jgi:phytoene synthase
MQHEMTWLPDPTQRLREVSRATDQVIRSHSKTFFFATGLLPERTRRGIHSLYAFCRSSDDLVDCGTTTQDELNAWRAEVDLPLERQTNPLLYAWASVREEYGINRRYESELLDGIAMDINFKPYQTWVELERYCYLVASTVGLLAMPIIGYAQGISFDKAAPYAIKLGIALQLTNILRDVGEDARRGRVYLPQEDLARFGLTSAEISGAVYDERFIALMRFEIERAREFYRQSLPGVTLLSAAARPAVGAAGLLYRAILDEIEQIKYRVHTTRAHTSGLKKLVMLPGILSQVITLKQPPLR